ncbi:glycosyltransferase family 2 protein [Hymenobacter chitinivorans]|uniref:Glycosyl transferase family 2 n=1 Tax=Hymenobacter chitinivorans DSM 11115 TaxID=1121954 RepID=A0A2M9BP40_9BACT|nr:glycosyltransferase [Hymenobacter chitinivorans]PJJ59716.1 glycosyl transferase family 2 [Hymenobacter chitinivorans DSM 11115]
MPESGLSVLIPVYNRNVTTLVSTLLEQLPDWGGPAEIVCLDDASSPDYQELNRLLTVWPAVRYQELPRNVGRSAIRNQLAAAARYPWLLLLDNDSLLPDDQFLARYAQARALAPVLVGGTTYDPLPPAEPELRLRWRYGRAREARPARQRQKEPYAQLTLNNLLIQAAVFRQFGLDENLTRYGHEDTKFGWLLRQAQVPVRHLDNPVLHDGLEPAAVFLEKSHQAVRNLALLYQHEQLGADTRLMRLALQVRRTKLCKFVQASVHLLLPALRRNLLSARPDLRRFDLLKLHWLLQELGQPVERKKARLH